MDSEQRAALDRVKTVLFGEGSELLRGHDLLGLGKAELEATYTTACQKLSAELFSEAAKCFAVLVALDHAEAKYWRGLAITVHRMKVLPLAELLYTLTLRVAPTDVMSRVYRAETMLEQGRRPVAWLELEAALEQIGPSPSADLRPIAQRAHTLLGLLRASESAAVVDKR